jgi:methylmalonyl-CoA mutase
MIAEIEQQGGMTKAVQEGTPKLEIERAAAIRQTRVDKGEDVIVGVNRYRLDQEDEIDILDIDNKAVREAQIASINKIRETRDAAKWQEALDKLREVARTGEGNLLAAAIDAARARATLGEISDAMEDVFGRHKPSTKVISGVYDHQYGDDPEYKATKSRIVAFAAEQSRKPSIYIGKMGQDGHDRGAKVIATAFADMGFDVHIGDLFETPAEVAEKAINLGVDSIGASSLAAGHKTLIPELVSILESKGAGHISVFAGGVIPEQDYQALRDGGVADIFGPGTNVLDAANAVMSRIEGKLRNEL